MPKRSDPVTEHQHQAFLFQWAEHASGTHPELRDLYAIPNFAGRLGKLTALHGAKLKAEGRKKGVPDVHLPHARGGFHSLYVEMKRRDATPSDVSPEQRDWHARLRSAGHVVIVAHGWEEARDALLRYLSLASDTEAAA